jgi:hypothetical protein
MPRCTTCSLLFKEPWDEFQTRLGGPDKADAYHYAVYLPPEDRLLRFIAAYCYGQEPQFAQQVSGKLDSQLVPMYDLFGEEHNCKYYQPATGHVERGDTIRIYHQQRLNMSTPPPSVQVIHNSGILNVNSTLTDVTQSIQKNDSLPEATKENLLKLFEEFKASLASTPTSHSEEAEVAAEQAAVIAKEFERKPPRKSALEISGKGLVEATKALAKVVPGAITIAEKIASFVAGSMG